MSTTRTGPESPSAQPLQKTRLDRFLAHALDISRTDAQKLVRRERVTVDGEPVRDPSMHVTGGVALDGEPVIAFGRVVLMMHKPAGLLSATRDPSDRTILDLVPRELRPRDLAPVGRLDKDTTGLILLTNDGQLNHRLTHPRRHVPRTYRVHYEGALAEDAMARVAAGLRLEDQTELLPAELTLIGPGECRLVLHQGVYHQVKRMIAVLGGVVTALHREGFGPLVLDPEALAPGAVRSLSGDELEALERSVAAAGAGGADGVAPTKG